MSSNNTSLIRIAPVETALIDERIRVQQEEQPRQCYESSVLPVIRIVQSRPARYDDSSESRHRPHRLMTSFSNALLRAFNEGRHLVPATRDRGAKWSFVDAMSLLLGAIEDSLRNGMSVAAARLIGQYFGHAWVSETDLEECEHVDDCECHSNCIDADNSDYHHYDSCDHSECHDDCLPRDEAHMNDDCDHSYCHDDCYSCDHRTVSMTRDSNNEPESIKCDNCSKTWEYRSQYDDFDDR